MRSKDTTPKKKGMLPLCHSPFLQDLVIALGRRSFKSLRYSNPTLTFEVENEEIENGTKERLNIEAKNYAGLLTKLSIWDDRDAWVFAREKQDMMSRPRVFEAGGHLPAMDVDCIAELICATLSNPFAVQSFWAKHSVRS